MMASSPVLREAITSKTSGLAEDVVGSVRASVVRLDDRAEQVVRRPRTTRPSYGGIATPSAPHRRSRPGRDPART